MDSRLDPTRAMPQIMGILNTTPDSFSDGGAYHDCSAAIEHGLCMWANGAHWIDVGGESTRPGSTPVSSEEEIRRVIPVIRGLKQRERSIRVSVDTSKTEVAVAAIEAGASMVNDVRAAASPGMAEVCRDANVDLVLMHMRGAPLTMQHHTEYGDLVDEVTQFLRARVQAVTACGMDTSRIIVDPGIGFGKAFMDNFKLIRSVPRFCELGVRVLIGASRKRFIGEVTGEKQASNRVFGSIGAALAAAECGAHILRVHDVQATQQALTVYSGVFRA